VQRGHSERTTAWLPELWNYEDYRSNVSPIQEGGCTACFRVSDTSGWRIVISPATGHVTLSHSVAGLAQLELVVADFKGVRLDNIFGRDRHQVERPGILFRASGPPCFQVRDDSSRVHFRSVWAKLGQAPLYCVAQSVAQLAEGLHCQETPIQRLT